MKEQMKTLGFGVQETYGIVMGKRMLTEFETLDDILETMNKTNLPVFIAAGTKFKPMTDAAKKYYEAVSGPKEIQIIKGANHTFDNWDYERRLFELTLLWLNRWLRSVP